MQSQVMKSRSDGIPLTRAKQALLKLGQTGHYALYLIFKSNFEKHTLSSIKSRKQLSEDSESLTTYELKAFRSPWAEELRSSRLEAPHCEAVLCYNFEDLETG